MLDWVVVIILFFIPVVHAGIERRNRNKNLPPPKNLTKFYLMANLPSILLCVVLILLNPTIINPDFSNIDRGFEISQDYIILVASMFIVPFFLAFMPTDTNFPKENIKDAKEIFGYETALMPNNLTQFPGFILFIVLGVVYEEIIFRLFMFSSFSSTLNIMGDWLVLVTAFLFSVGHINQGLKGVISSFILGLATGKLYLLTGNILVPIFMHASLNLTIAVYALRRIIALNKLKS